jgi:hypothetical protein
MDLPFNLVIRHRRLGVQQHLDDSGYSAGDRTFTIQSLPSRLAHPVVAVVATVRGFGGQARRAQGQAVYLTWGYAVGRAGLEPTTPCVSCKCATNCANGPWRTTIPLQVERTYR